jgi:mono/diheme cytochrome c family protein
MALVLTGCEKKELSPPDRGAQVSEAGAMLTEETFDTIGWDDDRARVMAGNLTFSAKCVRCHGPLGRGGTEYSADRGLAVPSLVDPDWRLADDMAAVRRRIFAGHEAGMPTWGVAGISSREIDAVAFYILEVLRPEVLESAGGG